MEGREAANDYSGVLSRASRSWRPMSANMIDTRDPETLELLEAWAREDATGDPEELRAAQKELEEFKRR